jgi:hypothetical protein
LRTLVSLTLDGVSDHHMLCMISVPPRAHEAIRCEGSSTVRPSWASSVSQGTDPLDAVEVEAVHGLVEDQHGRSASSAAAMPRRWPMPSENEEVNRPKYVTTGHPPRHHRPADHY